MIFFPHNGEQKNVEYSILVEFTGGKKKLFTVDDTQSDEKIAQILKRRRQHIREITVVDTTKKKWGPGSHFVLSKYTLFRHFLFNAIDIGN